MAVALQDLSVMAAVVRRLIFSKNLLNANTGNQLLLNINSQTGVRFKSKFRAAVLHEFKKPLVIEEHKQQKLGKHDVRINVEYCSVNASDIMICNNLYEITPKLPFIPGFEVSGEVLEVGSKAGESGLKVGDRVVGLNKDNFSGFAEECVLTDKDVWLLPNQVKCNTAVALVDSYTTALIGLCRRGQLKETDIVLITAGAGGLGLAAVDITANVFRAKVIAVCETEEKAAKLREKGAWAALTYNPKETVKKCNEVTHGNGVRLVFDSVGSQFFNMVLKCVAPEGILIVAGAASRLVPSINLSELLPKSFSLIGVSLRNYRASNYAVYRQVVQDAIDMADQGLVNPVVAKEFPLDKVNDAMQYIVDGKSAGKVVISMRHEKEKEKEHKKDDD